jgi:hypothetical protein
MIRAATLAIGVAIAAVLTVGCDDKKSSVLSNAPSGVESMAEAGRKQAEVGIAKGKEEFIKPVQAMIPKIEEKIKGLTGDAKATATTKLDDLKTLITDFMAATPDKLEGLKTKVTESVAELKKMVGL